ncbi:uncharacterized protein MKK02DRAFT_24102 [Dioszegia hungarica]|uniref:N-acetyltransferase domain-containing protein n=1 Tax=Dioszegia hungarica TaxID=4972 RepID=A0AA38HCR6_9TREE|nr:uncharacterized protein MKK02DRAFT_24102 [Dioszegia hungarica]KAI9637399.1 hypothetical protein MKK02DRAFT_24102 [Dioszegia hungarica]
MTTLRPFSPADTLCFNGVNSDFWTATYHNGYYSMYAATWPSFCVTAENTSGQITAYMLGKDEPPPPDPNHHGHLTALSISPGCRGVGLARVFMNILEALSGSRTAPAKSATVPNRDAVDAWFVDLFVRCNNERAVEMYERMGYSVFRRVVDYYTGMGESRDEKDGFDMRKSMPRDTAKRYVRPNGRDLLVEPDQVWA